MRRNMDNITAALNDSGIVLKNDTVMADICRNDWASHPIWLAYATRLDQSQIMFFLPDMYDALVKITGVDFGCYEAYTRSGDITLYIIGTYEGDQPVGPFWDESMGFSEKGLSASVAQLLKFGKEAQNDLSNKQWITSCRDSEKYLSIHRGCVRRVGKILGIDMEDHDLTKSRIVQVALGYMWHWSGDGAMRSESLMKLASEAIKAGHLERENHHPEYHGEIDPEKMFADRLAVHLQKDKPDGGNGWLLNPKFIPDQYKDQWKTFREKNEHLNMYDLVWNKLSLK